VAGVGEYSVGLAARFVDCAGHLRLWLQLAEQASSGGYARSVSAPEPMLSTATREWPDGGEWTLQPKWDGFRLFIEVCADGRVRGWSRHGTSLTAQLDQLLVSFEDTPAGSVFDGELVAVSERDGRAVQDYAAVCRAVLRGDVAAARELRFVGFDLLGFAGEDLRDRPWRERDRRLADALPGGGRVRRVECLQASPVVHAALLGLGFEGSVLKRQGSLYRPGRQGAWLKHKARRTVTGVLTAVRQDRDGHWHGICDVKGRRVVAVAGAGLADQVGELVSLVYSRVDADGSLREVRIAGLAVDLPPGFVDT
jgi:ATP-dependent DNA ligase